MKVIYKDIEAKSILSKSGIPGADYCMNPYVGCLHSCRYCYATFMKKYTGHTEPWGSFIDIRANAPEALKRQIRRARKGTVMVSSVTDPYQPIEARRKLTRRCLEVLLEYQFPVFILTKSPLVLRDMDVISRFNDIEVGLTITTDDERIRRAFEPKAPSFEARVSALRELHARGIKTYAFIGPVLPMDPQAVCQKLKGHVDYVHISRMNYLDKSKGVYKDLRLQKWLDPGFTAGIVEELKEGLSEAQLCA